MIYDHYKHSFPLASSSTSVQPSNNENRLGANTGTRWAVLIKIEIDFLLVHPLDL